MCCSFVCFFKQKTAYEMRISDWSSDVCSSDLLVEERVVDEHHARHLRQPLGRRHGARMVDRRQVAQPRLAEQGHVDREGERAQAAVGADVARGLFAPDMLLARRERQHEARSEEHTSELQSLMRISYAVFCLKKKKNNNTNVQHMNTST